jgi:hypothetical protein
MMIKSLLGASALFLLGGIAVAAPETYICIASAAGGVRFDPTHKRRRRGGS